MLHSMVNVNCRSILMSPLHHLIGQSAAYVLSGFYSRKFLLGGNFKYVLGRAYSESEDFAKGAQRDQFHMKMHFLSFGSSINLRSRE